MFIKNIKNAVYPTYCILCQINLINDNHNICSDCWKKIIFINKACNHCGYPLDILDNNCIKCFNQITYYNQSRSIIHYNYQGKKIISQFKFFDKHYFADYFVRIAIQNHPELFANIDFIIPIPCHLISYIYKGYDQSIILAKALNRATDISINYNILKRKLFSKSQKFYNYIKRRENIKTSFYIKDSSNIKNSNILLVDDIITTGFTVNFCSELISQHNPNKINILSIARTMLK